MPRSENMRSNRYKLVLLASVVLFGIKYCRQPILDRLPSPEPVILTAETSKIVAENKVVGQKNSQKADIIFLRTSTEPLAGFELCCFYAAAKHNPELQVKVLSFQKFEFPTFLNDLKTVHSEVLDFSNLFIGTPLQKWYESRVWNVTSFIQRVRYLCDAARHAFLYKHGGYYLDTDSLTLKNFDNITNALGWQIPHLQLNGAFISVEKGHPFMKLSMQIEADTFQPGVREIEYGPLLLTRAYKRYLEQRKTDSALPPMQALPDYMVYPYEFSDAVALLAQKGVYSRGENRIRSSIILHMWRNKMRRLHQNPMLKARKGSVLYEIAKEHCAPVLEDWMGPAEIKPAKSIRGPRNQINTKGKTKTTTGNATTKANATKET